MICNPVFLKNSLQLVCLYFCVTISWNTKKTRSYTVVVILIFNDVISMKFLWRKLFRENIIHNLRLSQCYKIKIDRKGNVNLIIIIFIFARRRVWQSFPGNALIRGRWFCESLTNRCCRPLTIRAYALQLQTAETRIGYIRLNDILIEILIRITLGIGANEWNLKRLSFECTFLHYVNEHWVW